MYEANLNLVNCFSKCFKIGKIGQKNQLTLKIFLVLTYDTKDHP